MGDPRVRRAEHLGVNLKRLAPTRGSWPQCCPASSARAAEGFFVNGLWAITRVARMCQSVYPPGHSDQAQPPEGEQVIDPFQQGHSHIEKLQLDA